ncbi:uncharacterized protein LOC110110045 [Dendrobium catenatum]|uniref:uncharacterized protein LOC110110045 n=1 Tax=Dendrobium catenatum TaxID=906689 RepID=UPI0009F6DDB6|nr:uncharacterized protein LOC110110045 [Dendrobium catenatum]
MVPKAHKLSPIASYITPPTPATDSIRSQAVRSHFSLPQHPGFKDCKPAPTPVTPNSKPLPANSPPFSNPSLPDISYATNRVCQHMQHPTEQDFKALKRLLRYINSTLSFGLPITIGNLDLHSYLDADWASDTTDRKSISGFCTFLGPNLIAWTVKKQATVAKSSTKAEYRSLSAAASDVI